MEKKMEAATGPISGDMWQKLVELSASMETIPGQAHREWAQLMVRGLFDDVQRVSALENMPFDVDAVNAAQA